RIVGKISFPGLLAVVLRLNPPTRSSIILNSVPSFLPRMALIAPGSKKTRVNQERLDSKVKRVQNT
ncbi:hypothetical protein L9F63_007642, partial [Diploptera punctata]